MHQVSYSSSVSTFCRNEIKDRNYKSVQQHIFISFSFSGKKWLAPPMLDVIFIGNFPQPPLNHSREKEWPPLKIIIAHPLGKLWILPKGLMYESRSLPHGEKWMRDKRTPKDVYGEATKAEEVGSWSINNKYFFYPHVGDYMGRNGGLTDWRNGGINGIF